MAKVKRNKWLTILVIGIILLAYATHPRKEKNTESVFLPQEEQTEELIDTNNISVKSKSGNLQFFEDSLTNIVKKIARSEKGQNFLQMKIGEKINEQMAEKSPNEYLAYKSNRISFIDSLKGTGKKALCGAEATIHYNAFTIARVKFDSSHDRGEPVTIRLGKGQMVKGLELGIIGMEEGGLRKIAIPPKLAFDDPDFNNPVIGKNQVVTYEVELLKVKEDIAGKIGGLTIADEAIGLHQNASCGSVVNIGLLAKDKNNNIFTYKGETLQFRIGAGKVPFGLEQAILDMQLGGIRRFALTPELMTIFAPPSILPKHISDRLNSSIEFKVELLGID